MTDFPELQHALVDAARRRSARAPRARRLVRPVLVVAASAAAAVAFVTLAGEPASDEHVASPPDALTADFPVLASEPTAEDRLPNLDDIKQWWLFADDVAGFDPGTARLVAEEGRWRLFLAVAPMRGRPALCVWAHVDADPRHGGCLVVDIGRVRDPDVINFSFPPAEGEPGGVLAAVRDGIHEVEATFADGSRIRLPVRDNAVFALVGDREPVRLSWRAADGRTDSIAPVIAKARRRARTSLDGLP